MLRLRPPAAADNDAINRLVVHTTNPPNAGSFTSLQSQFLANHRDEIFKKHIRPGSPTKPPKYQTPGGHEPCNFSMRSVLIDDVYKIRPAKTVSKSLKP
ncbi:MAG: hypothetical protein CMM07_25090 [Rhodopirellula sp.]|nr:hypothetical protein [Rhodopirellula sp.]